MTKKMTLKCLKLVITVEEQKYIAAEVPSQQVKEAEIQVPQNCTQVQCLRQCYFPSLTAHNITTYLTKKWMKCKYQNPAKT